MSSSRDPLTALFRVPIRELPTSRVVDVPGAYVDGLLRGLPMRDALERPVGDVEAGGGRAELELASDDKNFIVTGTVKGWLEVACSRCVGTVRVPIDEQVVVTYMPRADLAPEPPVAAPVAKDPREGRAKDVPGAGPSANSRDPSKAKPGRGPAPPPPVEDDEDEMAEGELDVFPYEGDVIDLEPLIREQFVLAVPYAPLCREDCLGLCPQCGVDKNVTRCSCEPPIDPRFAALKGLKPHS